jgi:hypothetical protein
MRKIPTHDLPRAAVNDAHQVGPTHSRPGPHFGHVRLPDLIWLGCLHAAPLFPPASAQTTRAHQQPAFTHHSQHPLAIHQKIFLSAQPPGHPPIAVRRFFPARHHDLFVVGAICPAAARLLSVVETGSADRQSRRHERGRVTPRHQLSRLGMNCTAAHSPTTFFGISISSDFRPSVLSNCRMRWSFSVSAAAALLPPSTCLCSLLCFVLPPIKQIRSDPMATTRLRDVATLDAFLDDLPLLFGGSIYAWFPAHAASCWRP